MTACFEEIKPPASSLATALECLSPHTDCNLTAGVLPCFFLLPAELLLLVSPSLLTLQMINMINGNTNNVI